MLINQKRNYFSNVKSICQGEQKEMSEEPEDEYQKNMNEIAKMFYSWSNEKVRLLNFRLKHELRKTAKEIEKT